MHATIEQLLEIKDGLQNDLSLHVESCDFCQAELAELVSLNQQLFEQANCTPGPNLWQRITQSAANSTESGSSELGNGTSGSARDIPVGDVPVELLVAGNRQQHNSLSRAIYTLAASILVTGFIGLYMFGQQSPNLQQNQLMQAGIQELMLNSRPAIL